MLEVWGRTNSVNVQKVLWCLAELGLEHVLTQAGLSHGINNEDWYLALNPNGKVPMLRDGALTLWESNTIVRYLSAKHGLGTLCPNDAGARADVERWMDWQLSTLARSPSIAFWNLVRTPAHERNMAAVERAVANTNAALDLLDRHLERRDYVGGAAFTMGDIPVGAITHRWLALEGIARPAWPALRAWFDRLAARPAYARHVMLPLS
jgi:glutathione S-transferase